MALLMLFFVLIALTARGIQLLWGPRGEETSHFGEDFLVFVTLGIMTWTGLSWFLALLGLLAGTNLILAAASGLIAVVGFASLKRRPISIWQAPWPNTRPSAIDLLPWILFAILLIFAFWRGYLLPTLNTDALFLSLPKADVFVTETGLNVFAPPSQEWMGHASQPSTYELLLATVMALGGDDHLTEWVASLSGAAFAICCWVLFRQWFKDRLTAHIGLLIILSSTVFLLHLSSDKADLTTNLACLLLIHWTSRALEKATAWNLGAALLSGLLLMGLKKSGWIIFPTFSLVIAYTAFKHRGSIQYFYRFYGLAGLSLVGFILLGGANQIYLWAHTGNPFGVYTGELTLSATTFSLSDPFRFLGLVALAPFISLVQTIRLPWSGAEWYWPQYNLFFSHFGYAFILILGAALVEVAKVIWRRASLPHCKASWRWFLLAMLAFVVIAIRRYSYDGGFNTFARFSLFLLPALLGVGLLPILDAQLGRASTRSWARVLLLSSATFLFSLSAWQAYARDLHAPWIYLVDLWQHPERRRWIFVAPNRVHSRLDRMAGPTDVIAADITDHTWLHPLWGEFISRKVLFIEWRMNRAIIPDQAQWVLADNVAGGIWGRGLRVQSAADLASARGWGQVNLRDTALYRQLKDDPRWTLILASPSGEQCLFQRTSSK